MRLSKFNSISKGFLGVNTRFYPFISKFVNKIDIIFRFSCNSELLNKKLAFEAIENIIDIDLSILR